MLNDNIKDFEDVTDAGYTIKIRYKLTINGGLGFLGFDLRGQDNSYIGFFDSGHILIKYVDKALEYQDES